MAAAVRRDERWWLSSYFDSLRQRGVTATEHVSDDPHSPAGIVTAARTIDPCLVCMATHGRARSAAVAGSTFTAVAARLGAPLVAVGPVAGWAESDGAVPDRVVVCLDGEAHAERSLPIAAGWARRLGLPLSLVTAADPLLPLSRHGGERAETRHFHATAIPAPTSRPWPPTRSSPAWRWTPRCSGALPARTSPSADTSTGTRAPWPWPRPTPGPA